MTSMRVSRRLASVARELKETVSTDWRVQGPYQWATVAVIHIGVGFSTLDVYLDSNPGSPGATLATGIPFLNGYNPTIGDTVLVARMAGAARTQRVILGPLETTSHGLSQAGEYLGADFLASGAVGLSHPANGRWLGHWTTPGPPVGSFSAQAGDWGFDSAFAKWICTAPGLWRTEPLGTVPGGFAVLSGSSISGISAEIDVTGCTITFSVTAGRAYKITGNSRLASTTTGDRYRLSITDASNTAMASDTLIEGSTNNNKALTPILFQFPSVSGSLTFKLRAARETGAGTVTVPGGSAVSGTWILAEDIGATTLQMVLQSQSNGILTAKGTLS